MIRLNDKMIFDAAHDYSAYQKGLSYAKEDRVIDLDFNEDLLIMNALVLGSKKYHVEIAFDRRGEIDETMCTCSAFRQFYGGCKHIVATLKKAQEDLNYRSKIHHFSSQKTTNEIFDYIELLQQTDDQFKTVALEVTCTISSSQLYNGMPLASVSLRMGEDRLYSVKSIKKFLENLEQNIPMEFGKNFTFNSAHHRFAAEDKKIIELFQQIYETEKISEELHYLYQPKSVFKGKNLYLSPTTLKALLSLLENKRFTINIFGRDYENMMILNEDLPLEFKISQVNENLVLRLQSSDVLMPLTKKGEYFFLNGNIYLLSDKQQQAFAPFFNALQNPKREIQFPTREKDRFASELLPVIKKIAKVSISPEIKERFYQADLNTEIYFDKQDMEIVAKVKFIYEEIIIDPFSSIQSHYDDKILIRDIENERAILSIFEQADFKVSEGKLYLQDEENVFSFLYMLLPKLQEKADVFYSDAFKNMRVQDPYAFTGSLRLNENSNLLEFSFHHDAIPHEELKDIFLALREKKKYHRLKDGAFLPLHAPTLQQMGELVEYLDIPEKDLTQKIIELPKYRALYLENRLKEKNGLRVEKNLPFKQLVQNINEPQDMEFEVPEPLKHILRDYQRTGFKWLKTLAMYGLGGILADDMGLGKTLQTISFILSEKEKNLGPALIIAPTSLVYNWQDEVIKFAPFLKAVVISGSQSQRLERFEDLQNADLVITSYALIRRDIELYKNLHFGYCFLDEAQHIKNPNSLNAKTVKQIPAKGYFALTGTPIENSLTELWSIFDFVLPGYLLTHGKFTKKYEKPIVKEQNSQALSELTKQIRPFIMRRLKKDVLKELPSKIEMKMTAELTSEQKKIYLAYLQEVKGDIAKEIAAQGFEKSQMKILAALTRLRQICCHPSLFLENYKEDSGKMLLLQEILEDALGSGHRILLFSQFTSMLNIIRNQLNKQGTSYFYLDGSIKAEKRKEMVDEFNAGKIPIFLISLKAGGTGLNLTGADMVIHYDPWWNPAVEEQATDRAYRIGQNNIVQVFKLVTQGTIEEKIYELQQKKRNLVESVIQPGETFLTHMNEKDIKSLFDIEL